MQAEKNALRLGVLADDLTGGMIIASLLEREGVSCRLVTSVDALDDLPADAQAVVIARKIRLVEPELAREEARSAGEAFKRLGAQQSYFKYSALFDSTDRGNIGPIAEVLLEVLGARRTIFCPAFTERGITIFQGRLFLGDRLAHESFKRHDPVTPALSSNLVDRLQAQTRVKVGLISHAALLGGASAFCAQIERQEGAAFFVADAADADDIERLAMLTRDWGLVTGGDSLAPAMVRTWDPPPERVAGSRLLPAAPGAQAVLAGSCAPVTRAQLEAFAQAYPTWRVDLAADGDDPSLAPRILDWSRPLIKEGPIAVATSADPDGVAAAQTRFGRDGAAERADAILASVARGLKAQGVRQFVVSGGETSGEVMAALGVRQVRVAPYDHLLGGYCHQSGPSPLSLVIKPGGMGEPHFFFAALKRLGEANPD